MNPILLNEDRSTTKHAGLEEIFWTEAIKHVEHLHNRTVSPGLRSRTPLEVLLGTTLDTPKFSLFGCDAYVHILKENQTSMFVVWSDEDIYVGNKHGLHSNYLPNTNGIATMDHVFMMKTYLPCQNMLASEYSEAQKEK